MCDINYITIFNCFSLQIKCQAAAIKFEKYNELHLEAKQAISDTELLFHKEMRDDDHFDQYWQEKLNIANSKVISLLNYDQLD